MADKIGKAVLEIVTDSKQFFADLDRAEGRAAALGRNLGKLGSDFSGLGKGLKDVGSSLTETVTVPIAGLVGALAAVSVNAIQAGSDIFDGAQQAGVSTQFYQELEYALTQISSLSGGDVTRAMMTLTASIGEAGGGAKAQTEALRTLGYSQREIASGTIDSEEAFGRLSTALQNAESPAQAMALAGDLMGAKVGRRLAEALRTSGGEVDGLRLQFRALGLGMTDDAIVAAESLGDELDTTKRQLAAAGREIAASFLPVIRDQLLPAVRDDVIPILKDFAAAVQGGVEWFRDLSPTAQKAVLVLAGLAVALGPALVVVGQINIGVGAMLTFLGALPAVGTAAIAIIKGLGTALLTSLGPALAVFAVGGAAYALTSWLMNSTEWGQKLAGALGELINKVRGIDTAQLERGRDVTKDWTDEEKRLYIEHMNRPRAIKGAADEAIAGEGRVKPALAGRKLTEQELVKLANERAEAAKAGSALEVELFGTSKLAAQEAGTQFRLLQQAVADSGKTMATMSAGQLETYRSKLIDLAIASKAIPEIHGQIVTKLAEVTLALGTTGAGIGTFAITVMPPLITSLDSAKNILGEISIGMGTIATVAVPQLSGALPAPTKGFDDLGAAAARATSGISTSTVNLVATLTPQFAQIGILLSNFGGAWGDIGNTVSQVCGVIGNGMGRIGAAQTQYGENSEMTSQITQDTMIDMGIGVGNALAGMGKKYKAAAIAGAIISTLLGVVKALGSCSPPANFILAALTLAAGMLTVYKIKSQPAYEKGTPGLDFASFGKAAAVTLHNREAVIPQGKGHLLAGEIAAAMPGTAGGNTDLLQRIADSLDQLPFTMNRAYRDALATSG